MSYVVFLENGGCYSDFVAFPIVVCSIEQKAKEITSEINDWKYKILEQFCDDSGYLDMERFSYSLETFWNVVPNLSVKISKCSMELFCHFKNCSSYFVEVESV